MVSLYQALWIAYFSSILDFVLYLWTFDYRMAHKFSIGFISGLLPGHSKRSFFFWIQPFCNFFCPMTWRRIVLEYKFYVAKIFLSWGEHMTFETFNIILGFHIPLYSFYMSNALSRKTAPNHNWNWLLEDWWYVFIANFWPTGLLVNIACPAFTEM